MPRTALVHAAETGTFSGSRNNSFIGKLVLYDLWAWKPSLFLHHTSSEYCCLYSSSFHLHPSTCPNQPPSLSAVVTGRSQAGLEGTGEALPCDCPFREQLPPPRGHRKNCSARRRQLLFLPNFFMPLPLTHAKIGMASCQLRA